MSRILKTQDVPALNVQNLFVTSGLLQEAAV